MYPLEASGAIDGIQPATPGGEQGLVVISIVSIRYGAYVPT